MSENFKTCKICKILDQASYSDETKQHINSLIKKNPNEEFINNTLNLEDFKVITDHYFKNHNKIYLKDFVIDNSKSNVIAIEDVVPNNQNKNENFDISLDLEKYRNMTFQEKEDDQLTKLKEIKFMSTSIIHHQLVHGRYSSKATIPKEDISALKQIEDILKNIEDVEEKKPQEIPTIFLQYMDKEGNTINEPFK